MNPRKICFRVWNKEYKEFICSDINDLFEMFGNSGELIKFTNQKKFIIQQFTGLKDKKKKDIYEGDILEFDEKYWVSEGSNIAIVKWDYFTGGWHGLGWFVEWPRYCKIIGNILENPNLIKTNPKP